MGGWTALIGWPHWGFESRLLGSAGRSLRVAFITDVHARAGSAISDALGMAAYAVNARRPDLVVAGGDLIDGERQPATETAASQWDRYLAMHESLNPPVYAAIGNRDLVTGEKSAGLPSAADPKAFFRERLQVERTYFSFDAQGYHFVILDSIHVTGDELGYEGRVDPRQIEWLRADLSRISETTPILLITHMPLVSAYFALIEGATAPAPRNRVVVNNLQVLELFASHRLLLVLQGHLHVREMVRWRGTTFLTGGAICGRWWNGPHHGAEEGFYLLTLRGEQIDFEYVDYGWEAAGT